MGNPAILSTVHLLPNERPGQWHQREREYSPKLPNRGNLAIAVARMPRVTLRVWSGQCEWEHTRGAPGELLTPNRDLPSPLFLGQRWRELFTQRVLVHLFPKQPPPQRAGHPRPPIMPKSTALRYWLGTRKLRNNSFWIHFQSSLFQAKMCRRKKVLQESHHFGLLSWLPIGIAHPDGWTGRAARWRRSLFRSPTSLSLSVFQRPEMAGKCAGGRINPAPGWATPRCHQGWPPKKTSDSRLICCASENAKIDLQLLRSVPVMSPFQASRRLNGRQSK